MTACLSSKVSAVLANLTALPWLGLAAVLVSGVLLGLAVSKAISAYVAKEFDADRTSLENAELRQKVEDLQQLMMKVEPLAYKSMRLRFTKGINKAVILGMVDTMLANKEVNIWWLPDQLERIIYFNMMTLMLSVLDEVVDGMSISFAGHNVRLSLTYLDVERGEGFGPAVTAKTEALLKSAMQPVKQYS
ncbi:hypothetical protein OEZ85_011468 [Tetradesmus obliquus]|uniref:SMP-LTD domain-containing protein n=1 Tax=Tetradesmus obliquus TaxID=3088 RepID=A0ABY8TQF5_TETOB|nr:hypothetical protein OEZ85_011468 [Tetradesmus obliquus]